MHRVGAPSRAGLGRLRPYRVHAFLLVYTPLLLVADSVLGSLGPQLALGVLTFGVLWACTRFVEPARRWEVWLCVPIATLFEVYGSLIWGGYTYRLHNIPLYVPPGHALVYVFGITAVTLPLVRRHGTQFRHGVLAVATAWAVAGVTVFPLVTHRWDVQGAILWPLLAWCILRSGRGEMFAAIWIATATIEIAGTATGDWGWAAVAPWSHLPSANPPSSIAAGYAVIDGSVALLAPLVALGVARLRTSEVTGQLSRLAEPLARRLAMAGHVTPAAQRRRGSGLTRHASSVTLRPRFGLRRNRARKGGASSASRIVRLRFPNGDSEVRSLGILQVGAVIQARGGAWVVVSVSDDTVVVRPRAPDNGGADGPDERRRAAWGDDPLLDAPATA
jgi:hypothetical protein